MNRLTPRARTARRGLAAAAVTVAVLGGVGVQPASATAGDYSYVVAGYNVRSSAAGTVIGLTTAGWFQTFCWTDAGGYRWFRGNYLTNQGWKNNSYVATVAIPAQASLPHC